MRLQRTCWEHGCGGTEVSERLEIAPPTRDASVHRRQSYLELDLINRPPLIAVKREFYGFMGGTMENQTISCSNVQLIHDTDKLSEAPRCQRQCQYRHATVLAPEP